MMLAGIMITRDSVMGCGSNVCSLSLSSKGNQPYDTHKSKNDTDIELHWGLSGSINKKPCSFPNPQPTLEKASGLMLTVLMICTCTSSIYPFNILWWGGWTGVLFKVLLQGEVLVLRWLQKNVSLWPSSLMFSISLFVICPPGLGWEA